MSEVILFRPKAELDAAGNLAGFVESCRNDLTVFGADLPFDENIWDVSNSISLKGCRNKRIRIVFSTLGTVNAASPSPMVEPFLGFAKAYMRYMHGLRPTVGFGPRLTALRVLEAALSEQGNIPNPIRTDAHVLNRAAQLTDEHYTKAAAYRIGGQLEMVATFLSENRLTVVPVRWRNHLKRPGDTDRVGKEFDERRQSKMPAQAALDALPKVFRLATEPVDVIVSSVAALLCASPDRISEVLMLPENCEVRQKNDKDNGEAYGLRWWPAKGAEPMVKWIVPSMASVVQEAIEKIRVVTGPARRVAKWYEDHPGEIYLESHLEPLRSNEWLSMREVADVIGVAGINSARTWCKKNAVKEIGDRGARKVRLSDVQKAVVAMLPDGFPILDKETGLKYSNALLVVCVNELGIKRGTYRCMIEPISTNQINTGLGGGSKHGLGSIFSRFGFTMPDGSQIKITTHQFRHYLNTIAQAGGMSQLDIAKWSGRKDIRQNAAYDHVTPDQMLQKIRDAVGDESQMFGSLAELSKKSLIPRDEFARLVVPTAHTTDLGFCIHDYTMSPCQLHRDCIHCTDLVCVKGDEEKERHLRQQLEEARDMQQRAEEATRDGYYGSGRWLEHHKSVVNRLSQLCSIMDDPNVPLGAFVQLAPQSAPNRIGVELGEALPPPSVSSRPTELMVDVMTKMGG
ncbi:integrase [Ferrovum sp.]|uniref:integrase n=1 Tax=Ferrovum sp. TaxID=2609467 RepID=UPI002632E889|nr:integrase [Ferrovum sp.]